MNVYTIGYEGVSQEAMVAALNEARIQVLVDVRAVPLSRRPGFSKNVLAAGLRNAGIAYIGLKPLGTPPEGREAARKGRLADLRRIYKKQLQSPEAMVAAAQLRDLCEETSVCLLCYERNPLTCHRSVLIEEELPAAKVTHLYA